MNRRTRAVLAITTAATLAACTPGTGGGSASSQEPSLSATTTPGQSTQPTPETTEPSPETVTPTETPTQNRAERLGELARCELRGPTDWKVRSEGLVDGGEFRGALVIGARQETIDDGTEIAALASDMEDGIISQVKFRAGSGAETTRFVADGGLVCITGTSDIGTISNITGTQTAGGSSATLTIDIKNGAPSGPGLTAIDALSTATKHVYDKHKKEFKRFG